MKCRGANLLNNQKFHQKLLWILYASSYIYMKNQSFINDIYFSINILLIHDYTVAKPNNVQREKERDEKITITTKQKCVNE